MEDSKEIKDRSKVSMRIRKRNIRAGLNKMKKRKAREEK